MSTTLDPMRHAWLLALVVLAACDGFYLGDSGYNIAVENRATDERLIRVVDVGGEVSVRSVPPGATRSVYGGLGAFSGTLEVLDAQCGALATADVPPAGALVVVSDTGIQSVAAWDPPPATAPDHAAETDRCHAASR